MPVDSRTYKRVAYYIKGVDDLLPHAWRRWAVCTRSDRTGSRVLPRRVSEHLVRLLARATQRRRVLFLLAILIGITGETGLLSAWFLWRANLVLILLRSHLAIPPWPLGLPGLDAARVACVPVTISNSGALPSL